MICKWVLTNSQQADWNLPGVEEFFAQKLGHQSESLELGSFGAALVLLLFFSFFVTFFVFLDFDFLGGAM